MKARKLTGMAALLALVAGTQLAFAGESLKVGDPAPKLQTGKWVQGEPVKEFEKGKAYIVEFWATWCAPCRASIPHLNERYQKFKDKGLVVIGQNCREWNESLVAPFVEKMGDKMTYRVALDDKNGSEKGKMEETWMEAAGRPAIPSAFLVDKQGTIAWIGHPLELRERVLEQVLAGTFDVQKAVAALELQKKNEPQLQAVWMSLQQSMQQKKWDEAQAKADEMANLLPEDQRDDIDVVRLNILFGKEDYPAAYKLVSKISDADKDNAMLQNQLAWKIATDPGVKTRDLKAAESCAIRAQEATRGKDAGILYTLARVKFMQGEKDQAIALLEKAVAVADPDLKPQFQKVLESYKRGEQANAN